MENNIKEMIKIAYHALDEKKAIHPKVIDISQISVLADCFIIASGNNSNQVQAMADYVTEEMAKAGYECHQTEGYRNANWIVLDFKDVVIHIFQHEDRAFYDLERIWCDGENIEVESL